MKNKNKHSIEPRMHQFFFQVINQATTEANDNYIIIILFDQKLSQQDKGFRIPKCL